MTSRYCLAPALPEVDGVEGPGGGLHGGAVPGPKGGAERPEYGPLGPTPNTLVHVALGVVQRAGGGTRPGPGAGPGNHGGGGHGLSRPRACSARRTPSSRG